MLAHQPLPQHPPSTRCSGDAGSFPSLLAPTRAEGRGWEAGEAAGVVVKMMVKEDCSRGCARVLSGRAPERKVDMDYISGETGPILGPTNVVGLCFHFRFTIVNWELELLGA